MSPLDSLDNGTTMEEAERTVFFVSDHTGITAEVLGHSLLARFEGVIFHYLTRPFIDSPEKVRALIEEIGGVEGPRPLVFNTISDPALSAQLREAEALFLDFFAPYLEPLAAELGSAPSSRVGRYHSIIDLARYQMRMDAVDFALTTDDGLGAQHYGRADLILVGVSRAGKTPTCLFLGLQYGIRAANYPLAEDEFERMRLPEALAPFKEKVFGLTIDPVRLHQIRRERKPNSSYASLERCDFEVKQAEALFRATKTPFLNTTTSSVEEIAATLMHAAGLKRRLY
jgi:[pyruvate, water dikinase]-phosphate phosphotransferase / [pyruvate, water dikinase] kinase